MTGAVGTNIAAVDYNNIRSKVILLLGTGSADKGYGQTILSSAVFGGNAVTKDSWDALRYDLMNIKYHQDGVIPPLVQIQKTDPIRYGPGNPNTDYDTVADQATLNRFYIASSQAIVSTAASGQLSTSWSTQAQCTLTATFDNANKARYFFNTGSKLRITSSRTGGAATAQNGAWTSLLSSVGTVAFGGDPINTLNFYRLTDVYQQLFQLSSSTPYSNNNYLIEVKSNVADNSTGTATQIFVRVTWSDGYVDPDTLQNPGSYPASNAPDDVVDGYLNLTVEEFKASGTTFPSGNFIVTSPSYSLSSIAAT